MLSSTKLLSAALCIVTACNVLSNYYYTARLRALTPPEPKTYSWVGDDHPTQLPIDVPRVGLPWADPTNWLLANDTEWGTLFETDGFSRVGPAGRTFQLAMVHQLHCLDVIRVGVQVGGPAFAHHVQHCLRYLRQAVLCCADGTLEEMEPQRVGGRWVYGASGTGMVHECRDWTALRRYMSAHPAGPCDSEFCT